MSALLLSPHNDDETLFAAFTIIQHRPDVVVCFPSSGDYGDPMVRLSETDHALRILTSRTDYAIDQLAAGVDLRAEFRVIDEDRRPDVVFAPHVNSSHDDHVAVALAANAVFGARVRWYHTYGYGWGLLEPGMIHQRGLGKIREGIKIAPKPEWVELKLRALLCYQSQIRHPRASQFFTWDLLEYMEPR